MKYTPKWSTCILLLTLIVLLSPACSKTDKPAENNNNNNSNNNGNNTLDNADSLAGRLLFLKSTKVQGAVPSAPSSNPALKHSLKDTLYLVDQLPRPIKFLHTNTANNVSGVFLQVALNGGVSSFYYDVPELENMKDNDTVSVIVIGIDPKDLKKPQAGEIRIVPYDKNKQPIRSIVRPLKIEEKRVDVPQTNGGCGLALPAGSWWNWSCSFQSDDPEKFWNEPNKVHSPQGQDVEGHCCNGNSVYPTNCPGDTTGTVGKKKLHFATYYKINFELFTFFTNGSFVRHTEEDSPVPLPAQSNFCGTGDGVVQASIKPTEYQGNWTISRSALPPNYLWKDDSLQLRLQTNSVLPAGATGYGNPGGVIHQLDCSIGSLVLIQLAREGSNAHLVKFYEVESVRGTRWND